MSGLNAVTIDDDDDFNELNYTKATKNDTTPYIVYHNDIKFKNHRTIDPNRAIWASDEVKRDFLQKDTDSIDYRVEECIREKCQIIDLSHMSNTCFEEFMKHRMFRYLISKIQHIFAKDSKLTKLPSLVCFTNLLTLDVSTNQLIELPELPTILEELIVNDNKLNAVNHYLPNLKRFDGSNNTICNFIYPKAIERINLNYNPIGIIAPGLDALYHLEIIGTKIAVIYQYKMLKFLDVSKTCIEKIPHMSKLIQFVCNDSSVSDISELTTIETAEIVRSNITRLHFIKSLKSIVVHSEPSIGLSKQYKLKQYKKNKNGVSELIMIN
jgi:hypothetical protein